MFSLVLVLVGLAVFSLVLVVVGLAVFSLVLVVVGLTVFSLVPVSISVASVLPLPRLSPSLQSPPGFGSLFALVTRVDMLSISKFCFIVICSSSVHRGGHVFGLCFAGGFKEVFPDFCELW